VPLKYHFPQSHTCLTKTWESQHNIQKPTASIQHSGEKCYQDLSSCDSGMSGLITSVLLPIVDRDMPERKF
jgi:hypothetical protein